MAMYIYEFEIYEDDEGFFIAEGRDFEFGMTQGEDLTDAVAMAADLLSVLVEDALMQKAALPEPTYGNEPALGGKIYTIAVDVSLDTIKTVSATEAARLLGVSRSRVSNMLRTGLLLGFRKGRDTFVTADSIDARLRERRPAGRPRKVKASEDESQPGRVSSVA